MVHVITFLTWITFGLHSFVAQEAPDKNFDLIEDFKNNKADLRADKFDLLGHSTEGGELIAYHQKDKTYLVVDIWLFGEMGKTNATYWVDKKLNFLIVKRTDYDYDKPFYEKDFKTTETTRYLSYNSDKVRSYNDKQKVLSDSETNQLKKDYEEFFKDLTKDLEIIK
jgi:hypothetical protein